VTGGEKLFLRVLLLFATGSVTLGISIVLIARGDTVAGPFGGFLLPWSLLLLHLASRAAAKLEDGL
jgi:hypothetical protein